MIIKILNSIPQKMYINIPVTYYTARRKTDNQPENGTLEYRSLPGRASLYEKPDFQCVLPEV